MKVRVIDDIGCIDIRIGDVYEVLYETKDRRLGYKCYVIVNNKGVKRSYEAYRFEEVCDNPLPAGWHYCACGTATTNKGCCCDCVI
jgi:hypothetical protein